MHRAYLVRPRIDFPTIYGCTSRTNLRTRHLPSITLRILRAGERSTEHFNSSRMCVRVRNVHVYMRVNKWEKRQGLTRCSNFDRSTCFLHFKNGEGGREGGREAFHVARRTSKYTSQREATHYRFPCQSYPDGSSSTVMGKKDLVLDEKQVTWCQKHRAVAMLLFGTDLQNAVVAFD